MLRAYLVECEEAMLEAEEKESLVQREERILRFWEENEIFEQLQKSRRDAPYFSFYDGPPFATGLPHHGNLLASIIKDTILRYKAMQGYFSPRRFGWDCHGLPVENEIEKAKELYGPDIEKYGIKNFNEECVAIVLRYSEEWKKTISRIGRWVDFSKTYRTMDATFMESVWWVFKKLYDLGLVYEGFKVMPFSIKLGTPLSNFEANLNYREINDPSLIVAFQSLSEENTFFLAWTTTPWTLISNLALTVNPHLDYLKVKDKKSGKFYILAKERLATYFKDEYEIVCTYVGRDLEGWRYLPLFPYFADLQKEGAFRVLVDDFVSLEEGTGIVHTAPAFGEADFFVCRRENIEPVCPVDSRGRFNEEISEYRGLLVKDADKLIIRDLKKRGHIFYHGQILHRYPFCWRSDTPLIYKAVKTWFVAVEKIKDKLIAANKKIHWVPEHIKYNRFGKWLENVRDWAISRNRYFGTPIPIWRSSDGDIVVIKSISDLEQRTGKKITDLHRQYIDDLRFEHEGKTYKRIEEVFDCWFESGSMPFAQNHYPFENKEETEMTFPADFIAEGLDQTRGWFYTLNVISVALFNKPAFKNVIVNGIVLAEDGTKMSKRLKNYPEPGEVINRYGSDAIRLYMLTSPAVKAEDLKFSIKGVELVLRQVLIPLWNSFFFLSTYANIYQWKPQEKIQPPVAVIDKWILSLLNKLILEVEKGMEVYDLNLAVEPFISFIDQLTNWYIRRSRRRFWADEDTPDRREAFETLYTVILTLCKLAAPFIPFLTEAIYLKLRSDSMPLSVHLCHFPIYMPNMRDEILEMEMKYIQEGVSLGHALRKEKKIKVRQPLSMAHIIVADPDIRTFLEKQKQLIADELNVKEIKFHKKEAEFITLKIKPNFPILGKRVGKLLPKFQKIITNLNLQQIEDLVANKNLVLLLGEEEIILTPEDVVIEREVKGEIAAAYSKEIAIALDTTITDELFLEGLAREIVNKINTMRREHGFKVTDRINVIFNTTETVKKCFTKFKDYICHEILAVDVKLERCEGREWDLNGEKTTIFIFKV